MFQARAVMRGLFLAARASKSACSPHHVARLQSLNYRRVSPDCRHALRRHRNCIKCKYTDCVEVCPVDCFHEGPNFLVIDPDECIDCTLCEPECPINAIYPEDDVPAGQEAFVAAERRAGQSLAGDHRTQGRPARRQGLGRQARQTAAARTLTSANENGRRKRPFLSIPHVWRAAAQRVFRFATSLVGAPPSPAGRADRRPRRTRRRRPWLTRTRKLLPS